MLSFGILNIGLVASSTAAVCQSRGGSHRNRGSRGAETQINLTNRTGEMTFRPKFMPIRLTRLNRSDRTRPRARPGRV